ncbi:MAG: multidrug effflux MFS transporter [Proteobacteria bacterium]|nr:multidrug effflux MFS transporter [Pseudomonadota bacterium]
MRQHRSLAFVLAALAMLGPFSIDTYLPSFPAIAADLHVDAVYVQQTLSVYLLCFAGMMLLHGTFSDSFGRRPVILLSLTVYTFASLGAASAPSLTALLVFRALQGLSAGAGTVVGRAMVRDRLAGAEAQRMLSQITMMFALAPALAPIIGGWLQVWFGWRAIFVFLTAFGLLVLLLCSRALPESLPREQRLAFHPRRILRDYWMATRHPRFLLPVFALGFASIGFFIYVAAAPHFVIDVLHLPETAFAWLFIPLVSGMVIGAGTSSRLAQRWSRRRIVATGYALMLGAAIGNLIYCLLCTPQVPWAVLPLPLYTFGMTLAAPVNSLQALEVFPGMRGLASSVQSFVQLLLFALVAAVVVPLIGNDARLLALAMCVFVVCSTLCLLLLRKMLR